MGKFKRDDTPYETRGARFGQSYQSKAGRNAGLSIFPHLYASRAAQVRISTD